eukprot:4811298-Prymnesium_polylepis.1
MSSMSTESRHDAPRVEARRAAVERVAAADDPRSSHAAAAKQRASSKAAAHATPGARSRRRTPSTHRSSIFLTVPAAQHVQPAA